MRCGPSMRNMRLPVKTPPELGALPRLSRWTMITINYGRRAELFAMRPPEKDPPINILEGAVRSGKTWCLHTKALYCCAYQVGGRKLFTGVSKQSVYNNVLTDLFDLVGP